MTKTEVKKALRSFLPAKRAYAVAKASAARVSADASSLRAVVITGMPRGRGVSDPVGDAACRIQRAADRMLDRAEEYARQLEYVQGLIELADYADGKTIIRLRWIDDVGFDFIPARINMDRRTMFRHYERAVAEIAGKTES